MMNNVNMRSNYNGSIRASVISRVDQDFDGILGDVENSKDNYVSQPNKYDDEYADMN